MRRQQLVWAWTVLLLALCCVFGLSSNAAVHDCDSTLSFTGANQEICPSGMSGENLGESYYARVGIDEPKLYMTMPSNEKDTTQLRPYADSNTQIWHFTRQHDGSYKVRSVSSNLYMELYNGLHPAENNETWHSFNNDLPDQRWMLKKVDNGYQFVACCNTNFLLKAVNLYGNGPEILISTDFSRDTTHFFITKLPYTSDYLSAPSVKLSNVYGGVSITWNKVAHATSYRIYRYNASSKQWVALKKTTGTSYVDKTVTAGKTYQYAVRTATPLLSKFKAVSVKYLAPPKLTVTNTVSGPVITWPKASGAAAYKILVKTTGAWSSLGVTTGTKLTHKKASYNVSYTYTAQCVTADGKTNTSAYDPTGVKNTIVKTPTVTVSRGPNGYQLKWNKISGADSYMVMIKSKSTDMVWSKLAKRTDNNYFYASAKSNQTYYFSVRCMDKNNKYISGYISSDKHTFFAAPRIKEFKKSSKTIKLAWNKITGVSKYVVYSWNGKAWVKRKVTASNAATFGVVGNAAQNQCFIVKCLNKNGKVISSYYETILKNGKITYYSPGGYSSKNKF